MSTDLNTTSGTRLSELSDDSLFDFTSILFYSSQDSVAGPHLRCSTRLILASCGHENQASDSFTLKALKTASFGPAIAADGLAVSQVTHYTTISSRWTTRAVKTGPEAFVSGLTNAIAAFKQSRGRGGPLRPFSSFYHLILESVSVDG